MKRDQTWELVPLTEDIWIGGSTVCGFSANGGKVLGASFRAVRILMTTMRMVMSVMMNMLIVMVSTSHAVASCRELAVCTLRLVVLVVLVVLPELQMEPLVRYLCRGF